MAYWGGNAQVKPEQVRGGYLRAIDPMSGREVWSWKARHPMVSSVLAIAGDLVFAAELTGEFNAYDARDGRLLWQFQTGSGIHSNPVTYSVGGRQYVAVPSGWGGWMKGFAPELYGATAAAHCSSLRCLDSRQTFRVVRHSTRRLATRRAVLVSEVISTGPRDDGIVGSSGMPTGPGPCPRGGVPRFDQAARRGATSASSPVRPMSSVTACRCCRISNEARRGKPVITAGPFGDGVHAAERVGEDVARRGKVQVIVGQVHLDAPRSRQHRRKAFCRSG